MAKKDLELEEFNFNDELDFNFDDEMGDGISQKVKPKDRGVVSSTLIGVGQGIKETAINTQFVRGVLRDVMPKSYGDIDKAIDTTTRSVSEMYDQSIREIRPRLNNIFRKLDQFIPEEQKTLKSINEKLLELTENSSGHYYTNNTENAEEQTVNATLESIFNQTKTQEEIEKKKEVLKDHIEKKRFDASQKSLRSIEESTSTLSQYTTNVTQAYQKKMLELSLRSYLTQREHLRLHGEWMNTAKVQYEAIVKNTSLPEYAKITNFERLKDRIKESFVDKLYGKEGFLKQGFDRLKQSMREAVEGIGMAMDQVDDLLSGIRSVQEMVQMQSEISEAMGNGPMSKAQSYGMMAGGQLTMALKDKLVDPLRNKLSLDNELKEKVALIARNINNPGGFIRSLRKGDTYQEKLDEDSVAGSFYRLLDWTLSHFEDGGQQGGRYMLGKSSLSGLSEASRGMDNKVYLSQTEIVPGYLARIHQELTMLRTKKDQPLLRFDYEKHAFIGESALREKLGKDISEKIASSGMTYSIVNAQEKFTDRKDITVDDKNELRLFFLRLSRIGNMEMTTENIRKTSAYDKLSSTARTIVDEKLASIDRSENKEQELYMFDKNIREIRSSLPTLDQEIANYVDAGYGDILTKHKVSVESDTGMLEERSLLKQRGDGTYQRDAEAFNALLDKYGIGREVSSDINVKEAIKQMDPAELLSSVGDRFSIQLNKLAKRRWNPAEALKGITKTRLFNWRYRPGEGDEGEHMGPMAQEVKANLGEDAAPDGKKLDLVSMNAANMAAVQELDRKIDQSISNTEQARKNKSDLLSIITDNVKAIRERLDKGILSLTVPAFSFKNIDIDFNKLKGMGADAYQYLADSGLELYNQGRPAVEGVVGNLNMSLKYGLSNINKFVGGESAMGLDDINKLTAHDLLNIRELQAMLLQDGPAKYYAEMIFKKYPQYKGLDTSDEAVDAAADDPNRGKQLNVHERSALTYISSIVGEVTRKLGRAGVSVCSTGYGIFKIGSKVTSPVFRGLNTLLKDSLNRIDQLINGNEGRFTAEDLRTIREMQNALKSKTKSVKEIAEKFFAMYPDYKELDTSDTAIEAAEKNPNAGIYKNAQDRSVIGMAVRIVSGISGHITDKILDFKNRFVPNAISTFKKFIVNSLTSLGKTINPIRDVYVPGSTTPRLRAVEIIQGLYRDSITEKTILSLDDIFKTKGMILDKDNNVVLTQEEILNGLYDSRGEIIKSSFAVGVAGVVGFGMSVKDKIAQSIKFVREHGMKAFSKIKDKVGSFFDEGEFGLGLGAKYLKEMIVIQTDIRDILLGDGENIKKRLGLKFKGKMVTEADGGGVMMDGAATEATDTTPSIVTGGGETSGSLTTVATGLTKMGKGLSSGLSTAKEKLTPALNKVKATGLGQKITGIGSNMKAGIQSTRLGKLGGKVMGGLKGGLLGLASMASSMLSGDEKESTEAPQQKVEQVQDPSTPPHRTGFIPYGKRAKGDNDGDGILDGSVEDRRKRNEELKAMRTKKGQTLDFTRKYTGEGLFGGILGKIGMLFSAVSSGLSGLMSFGGKMMGRIGGWLTKLPGVGKLMGGLSKSGVIGKAVGGLWSAIKGFGGRAIGMAAAKGAAGALASTAAGASTAGGALAAGTAAGVGGTIATGLSAIATALFSAPVLGTLAVVGAGYGLYRLYKYLKKKKLNEFDYIRLTQYGLERNTDSSEYHHMVIGLESYLMDGKVSYSKEEGATIDDKQVKPEDLIEFFKADKEDEQHCRRIATWYRDRFKPFFLKHLTNLYIVDEKAKLHESDTWSNDTKIGYLESDISYDSGPYDITTSPIKTIEELPITKPNIPKEIISTILPTYLNARKKEAKPIALPVKEKLLESDKVQQAKLEEKNKAAIAADIAKSEQEAKNKTTQVKKGGIHGFKDDYRGDQAEGDGAQPTATGGATSGNGVASSKAPSSVPMAPGTPKNIEGMSKYIKLAGGVSIKELKPSVYRLLNGMAEEYGEKTGQMVDITSGYRSTEQQRQLKAKYGARAATPGRSLHEFGLAIDMDRKDANAMDELGLMKKYGFTRPVGQEPWHVEPAGIQGDINLARKNPEEAERMVEKGIYRGGGGYGTDPKSTKYRRNNELAMRLLGAEPSEPKEGEKDPKKVLQAASPLPEKASTATEDLKTATSTPATEASSISQGSQAVQNVQDSLPSKEVQHQQAVNHGTEAEGDGAQPVAPPSEAGESQGDIKSIVKKAAKMAGVDENLMLTMAQIESSMGKNLKAGTSSAKGVFQFIDSTWKEMVNKHAAKYQLSRNVGPDDHMANSLMAAEFIKQNSKALAANGHPVNPLTIYMAHFLGAGGVNTFLTKLKANPNQSASEAMPKEARSNPGIFRGRTLAQVYQHLADKVKKRASEAGATISLPEVNSNMGQGLSSVDKSTQGTSVSENTSQSLVSEPTSSVPSPGMETETTLSSLPEAPSTTHTPAAIAGTSIEEPRTIADWFRGLVSKNKPQAPVKETVAKPSEPIAVTVVDPNQPKKIKSDLGGVFISRTGADGTVRQESGQGLASIDGQALTSILDQSLNVQKDQLSVLKTIADHISPEKLVSLISNIMPKPETEKDKRTEKDLRNMNRTEKVASGALDLARAIR